MGERAAKIRTGGGNRPLPGLQGAAAAAVFQSGVLRDAWGQEDFRGRLDTKGRSPLTVKKARTLQASPTDSSLPGERGGA